MGPEGTAAVSDRGLRHRQVPSADRTRHRGRHGRQPGQVHPGDPACQRARRGRRRDDVGEAIARYGRVDLLCIDELGYMQLDRRGAELLFQVLTEREEKASVAIASNESFGGWTKTFTDPRLCAAIVDRLTFGGTILETGTDSYRLAQATKQRTT
ncbi:ATP-binding protein [Kribbella sp. NPDC051620]|uniref:ATP-binding protein n=1 Tax=Kribbella sp. NPDC051620 TaxID=3364120 RepID=UPI0037BD6F91